MLVGILSDSHGRFVAVREALQIFDRMGVGHIIHCGDVGGTEVFDELVGRPCTFVWGNTDDVDAGVIQFLQTVGIPIPTKIPTTLELDGKSLAVFHGHEPEFAATLRNPRFDYILHGHTHEPCDERQGPTRIINPGALHRARRKTVATLDAAADEVIFHELPGL